MLSVRVAITLIYIERMRICIRTQVILHAILKYRSKPLGTQVLSPNEGPTRMITTGETVIPEPWLYLTQQYSVNAEGQGKSSFSITMKNKAI